MSLIEIHLPQTLFVFRFNALHDLLDCEFYFIFTDNTYTFGVFARERGFQEILKHAVGSQRGAVLVGSNVDCLLGHCHSNVTQ